MRSFLWIIACLLIFVGLGVGLVAAFGAGIPFLWDEKDTLPPPVTKLYGGGSSFVNPLMQEWCKQYIKNDKPVVYYASVGSGNGVESMLRRDFDFGATDAFIGDDQLSAQAGNNEVLHIPLAMGAVVLAYHVPGLEQPLKLDAKTVTGIFLGTIKKWNDKALQQLNVDQALPDRDILVAHRTDKSGTTAVFTEYLTKVSPTEWGQDPDLGKGTEMKKWKVGVGAVGNEGIAKYVKETEGAIGYLELTYAKKEKLQMANLKNQEGFLARPELANVTSAAEGAAGQVPPDLRFELTNMQGKEAYPICGTVWAVVYVKQKNPEKAKALAEYFRWVTHEGQNFCEPLNYARLPKWLVDKVDPMLAKLGK